jgi:hypothetical protein
MIYRRTRKYTRRYNPEKLVVPELLTATESDRLQLGNANIWDILGQAPGKVTDLRFKEYRIYFQSFKKLC